MEEAKGSGASSSSSSSRWNPTKEQISVLEGLYKQGIRTPSAEQIQQITGKLREYGNIEGKNVFYWFQNHKARQRQKQKQESFAYFSRLLHHAPPPPAPPMPTFPPMSPSCTSINVACSPYYLYQPHQFAPVFPRSGSIEEGKMDAYNKSTYRHGYYTACGAAVEEAEDCSAVSHETLQLFPVHPTGILEEKSPVLAASPEMGRLEGGEGEVVGQINHGLLGFFGGRTSKQR